MIKTRIYKATEDTKIGNSCCSCCFVSVDVIITYFKTKLTAKTECLKCLHNCCTKHDSD
jgi:hypothetical protein